MNFIEKYIERKLRRISWKISNKANSKKSVAHDLINGPLMNEELKRRMELSESIRQLYNIENDDEFIIESCELDEDILIRINNLQELLSIQRKRYYSDAQILEFLMNAMNYGKFQLWLMENKLNGIDLNLNDKLKKFLSETSDEQILGLYDIEQNFNNVNNLVEEFEQRNEESKKCGIHPYDGYVGEPFFTDDREYKCDYNNPVFDSQMSLQLRPVEEIRRSIRNKLDNEQEIRSLVKKKGTK